MAITYSMMPTALIMEAPNLATVKVWHHIFVSVFGRNGKWDLSHQQIADAVGCNRVTVKRAVAWLAENGWVTQHFQGDRRPYRYEVFIPGGDTHPTGSPGDPSKAAGSPDDPSTGSLDDPSSGSLDDPHQERVPGESSRREDQPPSSPAVTGRFDDFWQVYPRKVGKRNARAAYQRALRRASEVSIHIGAARYANDPNRTDEFTAHPTTWLNRDGWEDDPLPPRTNGKPSKMETVSRAMNRLAEMDQPSLIDTPMKEITR